MSRTAGTVSILPRAPPAQTRWLAKQGRKRVIGSSSWKRPSSYSIMMATAVSGLVIE